MYPNKNYLKLSKNYLFSEIGKRIAEYERAAGKKALRLSIGDVTLPLAPIVTEAMKKAIGEMGRAETFRGYGEEQGYLFLREAIAKNYERYGVTVNAEDVFVSDGAKSDCGNLGDLFAPKNKVLLPDPVYPAYCDANIIAGRKILYMQADEKNEFLPMPDCNVNADIIYLCSPNNPTGAAYSVRQLEKWTEYALKKNAVILYDAAYACFIPEEDAKNGIARSVYEAAGAQQCAIEIRSFSKSAGFTGVRCGYCVVPSVLKRKGVSLKEIWKRRQGAKFNGVSYIVQRGAEAALSEEGIRQNGEKIGYYMRNAQMLAQRLRNCGVFCTGGKYAPYVWMKRPYGKTDEEFFAALLSRTGIAVTPGNGFGRGGEGYMRLSAFCSAETAEEACARLENFLKQT